jgi:hypothetical protein
MAKAKARIEWDGSEKKMQQSFGLYKDKVYWAMYQVALYWTPVIEDYAKTNARWIDRTSNARQGLHAFVDARDKTRVAIYLSHAMPYGIWLEIRWHGRYAIILPTLQHYYGPIRKMIKEIFS